LFVPFPSRDELHTIIDRTTTDHQASVRAVVTREDVLKLQALVRRVPVPRHVQDYAIRLLQATHPEHDEAPDLVKRFVRTGGSPRGVQAMLLGAKIRSLFDGRFSASIEDVKYTALPSLRHRILLSFEGEAEGVEADTILTDIMKKLPATKE
jgi:MoxR-like ATPase